MGGLQVLCLTKGQAWTFSTAAYLIYPQLAIASKELSLIHNQGDILSSLQTWENLELSCDSYLSLQAKMMVK